MGSWPWATVLGLLLGDLGAVNEGLQWAVGVGDSLFLSSGGLKDWVCRSQIPAKSQPTKATSHKCLVRRISGPPQPTPAPGLMGKQGNCSGNGSAARGGVDRVALLPASFLLGWSSP